MDSSLPVLVSRLPDRSALARLVRAALKRDIVQLELARGPQNAEAHTLDLHVDGVQPLALLAEPAGPPQNGLYPLRLRPLYRAQTTQLYALLRAMANPVEGLKDTSPDAPRTEPSASDSAILVEPSSGKLHNEVSIVPPRDAAPIARAMTGAAPPPVVASTQPLAGPLKGHLNRTAPMAVPLRPANDPRRTAPLRVAGQPHDGHAAARAEATPLDGADADDASLSVNVVFDDEPFATPNDVQDEEPSLSVSVRFEPDAIPELVRNARAAFEPDPTSDVPATVADAEPATIARPESSASVDAFFDEVLANFPAADLDDMPTGELRVPSPLRLDDDELVRVPPPPDDGEQIVSLVDDDSGSDNDDTLVRVSEAAVAHPPSTDPEEGEARPGAIVSNAARADPELTPTDVTPVSSRRAADAPPTRARKRSPSDTDESALEDPAATTARPRVGSGVGSARGRADPALGRRIAEEKYVIESLIGSGGAGAVYRATHRELRRTVAIKLLHPHYQHDPEFMESFRSEALAASQLDHPNVTRVLDFGQEPDGLVYIVMEYLSGRTLQSLLDEERRLPTQRAVEIMVQVCAALTIAHDHGTIHRDIKPDNIMLVPSRDDEGATFELVKVCDFGIAALQNTRAEDDRKDEEERVIAGTPEYMSPEQARGTEIDARSDVYACGICLYELVTGRPPFIGEHPGEILVKQLQELPKPPSQVIKGLDPILEEIILRAIQKEKGKRQQSARELRVELKELIEPGEGFDDDQDELSVVENVPSLDNPASGFPGFFIAFSSALLRFGRFERGHEESAQAMRELLKQLRMAIRGRSEVTFARRDVHKTLGFAVMSGTAEVAELRRLLGSQLMGSFGEPFMQELVKKGIIALTLREGIPETEVHYIIEMVIGPLTHEELKKELMTKPLRHVSVLFVSDVVGLERKLAWKVGLTMSRLTRDIHALCNVRGISLKKMREARDQLVGGVARLLTRGEEVRQFLYNAELVDEAVANLRGFSSFQVAPLIVERVLHESSVEATLCFLADLDAPKSDPDKVRPLIQLFAARLITERSPKSNAAVGELCKRNILNEADLPRDLLESIRAQALAEGLIREPAQFLLSLNRITDPEAYIHELETLEAAMATLARRAEAVALLAVMSTLARHAKGAGKPGPRENAALRTMKSILDQPRLVPIATTLLVGPRQQHDAARQLIILAGSVGVSALYEARELTTDPAARPVFVNVLRETGPAGWTLLSQVLPRLEVHDDAALALTEDLLRAMPERADPLLGETVAKFLTHPLLRPTALSVIGPLWGERAKKPLIEALEFAEEPARVIALTELRRLRAIDELVFGVIERFLTMRGMAGEDLRAAAAAAIADVSAPLRARAVQLLSKAVEGKRGFVAMLRGDGNNDESILVIEAMGRALLALDRQEGIRVLKARMQRSDPALRARITALLQTL